MRLFRAMYCAAAIVALLAAGARADEYNKTTYVTFSGAVQIPGASLPAGTYTFKLADPENSRRVIQVWNRDTSHLYATLLTMPYERMDAADKPIVMFKETPTGESPAVQAWFYPGERNGWEFVYPHDQAMKIAKATHQPVLSTAENTQGSDAAAMRGARIGRVEDTGQFAQNQGNDAAQPASRPPTTTAPVATSGQRDAQPVTTTARRELPKTASPLPLFELLSLALLAAAFGVRRLRKSLV